MLKVIEAETKSDPFSLIFMDVRMPPGIDGIQTVKLLRNDYPHLEFVICTAFSDYSWEQIAGIRRNRQSIVFTKTLRSNSSKTNCFIPNHQI